MQFSSSAPIATNIANVTDGIRAALLAAISAKPNFVNGITIILVVIPCNARMIIVFLAKQFSKLGSLMNDDIIRIKTMPEKPVT